MKPHHWPQIEFFSSGGPESQCLSRFSTKLSQSPSAVILEPRKTKSVTVSIVSSSIWHEVMGPDAMILVFWKLGFRPTFSLSSFTFMYLGGIKDGGVWYCSIGHLVVLRKEVMDCKDMEDIKRQIITKIKCWERENFICKLIRIT